MFGFGKKKNQGKPQKRSTIDKLIMGAIVGGAVGSVIGMSIAPQKGKETRDLIAKKGKEFVKKGQEIGEKITTDAKEKLAEVKADAADYKEKKHQDAQAKAQSEILQEAKHHKKKLISRIKDRMFGRSKKVKKDMMKEDNDMKKIPNEVEET